MGSKLREVRACPGKVRWLRPKPGDGCVFCSCSNTHSPSRQAEQGKLSKEVADLVQHEGRQMALPQGILRGRQGHFPQR